MKRVKDKFLFQNLSNSEIKKIVCFGGGNAMPKALLETLKRKQGIKITSVASMFDSGGSSGKLREELNVLPPGDIRRHLLAMSEAPDWKKELWEWRFNSFEDVDVRRQHQCQHQPSQARHQGHNFGNVFLAGLEHILKDYRKVLEIADDFMEVKHRVLPVSIDKVQLAAELKDGTIIEGEDEIDVPKKHNPNLKIKKLFLKPKAKIFPETKKAILKADLITFGPGDLYSSIIPCLLPEGAKEAFKKTKARKIFICPAMTKLGETNNFSVLDFIKEAEKYLGCLFDFVIYNTEIPAKKRIEGYKQKEKLFLDLVKIDPELQPLVEYPSSRTKFTTGQSGAGKNLDKKKFTPFRDKSLTGFIGKNILVKSGPIIYDSKKVVKVILNFAFDQREYAGSNFSRR